MTNSQQDWVKCMFPFHHSESQEFSLSPIKSTNAKYRKLTKMTSFRESALFPLSCFTNASKYSTSYEVTHNFEYVYKLIYHIASSQNTITMIITQTVS